MADFEDSIAYTAHGYVHGERAKTYGHPRFDFTAIGKVWTGLLRDLLKEGTVIDPYRVAVLMTGLKLCRLVKSPDHKDSRIDTIGYMLTMERLDEPEEVGISDEEQQAQADALEFLDEEMRPEDTVGRYNPKDIQLMEKFATEEAESLDDGYECCDPYPERANGLDPLYLERANQLVFTNLKLWFEPGESKWVNGQRHVNTDECGKIVVFPIAPGTNEINISKHPPPDAPVDPDEPRCPAHGKEKCEACSQNPDPSRCQCGYFESTGMHWDTCPGRIRTFPGKAEKKCACPEPEPLSVHRAKVAGADPRSDIEKLYFEDNIERVKRLHSHEFEAPCIPSCPVWEIENAHRPKFEFTGETVEVKQFPGGITFGEGAVGDGTE